MPFIWNDERAEFVGSSAEYNQNEFFVVRKLFLQFKDDAKDITESWIQEKFENYGKIDQIEIFHGEKATPWAYITFSEDKDAYSAYTDASSSTQPVHIEKILPADTWCQPVSVDPIEDDAEEIKQIQEEVSRLNINSHGEDAIDASSLVRRILSSKSAAWKNSIANQIELLSKKFTFVLMNPKYGPNIPIREARSILRAIGPYVRDLCVRFIDERWPPNIERYFAKMCQYVGPNLKTLRLINVPPNEEWLQQLKPLLSRIDSLHVKMVCYDFDLDLDFQSYCPNLKTLKIRMNLRGELLTKPWPSLERFSNRDNQYMEERLVLEFMKNNPQLKYFKVFANDCNNFLQQIPEHLINLEKLCLYEAYPSISGENLVYLVEMKPLKRLKLMYLDESEFDGIVACLPKFKQLQELKLHVFYDGPDSVDCEELFEPNLDAIVILSQELQQLECFHIRYCQINPSMLYDFLRNARKLKSVRIYRCGLQITDAILEAIDSIRKSINPMKLTFYADKINPELNAEKTYQYVELIRK